MRNRLAAILWAAAMLASLPRFSAGQWVSLGGPGGCGVQALAASGSYIFAGTAFDLRVDR